MHPRILVASLAVILAGTAHAQECTNFPLDAPVRESLPASADLRHLRLEADLRPEERVLYGRALLELDIDAGPDSLVLFAPGMQADSVLAGVQSDTIRTASFDPLASDTLVVRFDSLMRAELDSVGRLSLVVAYHTRGVRFGDHAAWSTDGEAWFPRPLDVGDRFTSDLVLTVPEGWTAAATGMVAAQDVDEDGRSTFLFSSPHELPARRIAFAAGVFQPSMNFADVGGGRRVAVVQLDGSAHPETYRVFAFMSDRTGLAYPFERYAQLFVTDVAKTVGAGIGVTPARALADARARGEYVPAADLAPPVIRQWFGSVVSPASWADLWLEEGLAAYFTAAYLGHAEGDDVYAVRMNSLRRIYLAEAQRYVRPLTWNRWNHPTELTDSHARAKGAWVMHMLRRRIGDDAFRDVTTRFVNAHRFTSATTEEFVDLVREAAGAGASDFLEPWIHGAGHPVLEVQFDADGERLRLRIDQTQSGDRVPDSFPLDLTLEIGGLGSSERFDVQIDARTESFSLPYAGTPRFVALDPDADLLLEAGVDQSASSWIAQLRYASTPTARLRAAEALAAAPDDPALLIGLRSALEQEQNALVRAAIVRAVGNLSRSDASERLMAAALEDSSAMVRRNALSALRGSENAAAAALEAAQNDRSYYVQAEAVRMLADLEAGSALEVTRSALVTPSHDDVIRAAGLGAFEKLHNLAPMEAMEAALQYSEPGETTRLRLSAVRLLGRLAEGNRRAADRLVELLTTGNPAVALAAAEQLDRIGDSDVLRHHLDSEDRPAVRFRIRLLLDCP